MKVTVEIKEVHNSIREIEVPDDATDAEIRQAAAVAECDAIERDLEYSHTLPAEQWTIRKENGNYVG